MERKEITLFDSVKNKIIFPLAGLTSWEIKCFIMRLIDCHSEILPYILCFQIPEDVLLATGVGSFTHLYKKYGIKFLADSKSSNDPETLVRIAKNNFIFWAGMMSINPYINSNANEKIKEKLEELILKNKKINSAEHSSGWQNLRTEKMFVWTEIILSSFTLADASLILGQNYQKTIHCLVEKAQRKKLDGIIIPFSGLCHSKLAKDIFKISSNTPLESMVEAFNVGEVDAVILENKMLEKLKGHKLSLMSFDVEKQNGATKDGMKKFYEETTLIVEKIKKVVKNIHLALGGATYNEAIMETKKIVTTQE